MADRRTSERLLVQADNVGDITMDAPGPVAVEQPGERLIVPPESLDRVCMEEARRDTEDRTEPIRLSFLALLAERDPLVQARLNIRRAHAARLEADEDEDRPTDPMILTAKFSG
jgi:hypothetical protein